MGAPALRLSSNPSVYCCYIFNVYYFLNRSITISLLLAEYTISIILEKNIKERCWRPPFEAHYDDPMSSQRLSIVHFRFALSLSIKARLVQTTHTKMSSIYMSTSFPGPLPWKSSETGPKFYSVNWSNIEKFYIFSYWFIFAFLDWLYPEVNIITMSQENVTLSRVENLTAFSGIIIDTTTKVTITVAYGIIFPAALIGNIVVICLVLKLPSMRSLTNMLLVNMCVANLLVTLFAMPYSIFYIFLQYRWLSGHLGNVTCKLTHFSYALSIAASIFALLLISLDRYYAVLHPFKGRPLLLRSTKCASLGIWILSCIFMSPYLFQFRVIQVSSASYCIIRWSPLDNITASQIYYIIVFLMLYSLPLVGIGLAYSLIGKSLWHRKIPGQQTISNRRVAEQSKRKVVRMLIVVVVVFALCWIPAHVMHFLSYFQQETYNSLPPLILLLFFWCCHANSAISPWLFLLMHNNFKQGARRLFKRPSWQASPQHSSSTHIARGHSLMARQGTVMASRKQVDNGAEAV